MITIKRRFLTLIEIMIVMFLIAMITGVAAYNYRGSLEKGRAFKSGAGIQKLEDILVLSLADRDESEWASIESNWKEVVENSSIVANPKELMKDGWGYEYQVVFSTSDGDAKILITSKRYEEYLRKNPSSI
jgi:general secretion pathway protein G